MMNIGNDKKVNITFSFETLEFPLFNQSPDL